MKVNLECYYIIIETEDGLSVSEGMPKEEVVKRVNEGYYGPMNWAESLYQEHTSSLSEVYLDTNTIRKGVIIKGSIVRPKSVKVVREYDIE